MGVGNYYLRNAKTVYVDKWDVHTSDDYEADAYHEYREFIDLMLGLLPRYYEQRFARRIWLDNDRLLLAESNLYRLSLVDWDSYYAVSLEYLPGIFKGRDLPHSADYRLSCESMQIFDRILERYDLKVRVCGWTSTMYKRMPVSALQV